MSAVVVGVDGSDSSARAAEWAAEEADRRHAPLHIVIANDDPMRAEEAVQRPPKSGPPGRSRCWYARARKLI
ncbi:universal stress protein [Saccharopolyspora sp. NPDC002376]